MFEFDICVHMLFNVHNRTITKTFQLKTINECEIFINHNIKYLFYTYFI